MNSHSFIKSLTGLCILSLGMIAAIAKADDPNVTVINKTTYELKICQYKHVGIKGVQVSCQAGIMPGETKQFLLKFHGQEWFYGEIFQIPSKQDCSSGGHVYATWMGTYTIGLDDKGCITRIGTH